MCVYPKRTSYCCWASALTSVRRSCVLRLNQSFLFFGKLPREIQQPVDCQHLSFLFRWQSRTGFADMGGMTFAREFFVCLILAADFTVGAHTFRRVCRCVRSFSESRYPLSGMKANVGRLCEKLKSEMKSGWGIKFMAAALPDFFSSADSGGSQRTGKCMYIKAWRNKRDFTGGTKPRCDRGREGPCFGV